MIRVPDKRSDHSVWCSVLTTEGHQHCTWSGCRCLCHLPPLAGGRDDPPRPHSVPRPEWETTGANNKRAKVRWLALRHADGLEHDRRVVALRSLGTGLVVGVSDGDDHLVDLEADTAYR